MPPVKELLLTPESVRAPRPVTVSCPVPERLPLKTAVSCTFRVVLPATVADPLKVRLLPLLLVPLALLPCSVTLPLKTTGPRKSNVVEAPDRQRAVVHGQGIAQIHGGAGLEGASHNAERPGSQ